VYDATEGDTTTEPPNEDLCILTAEEVWDITTTIADAAWRKAMDEEKASIAENNTWERATLSAGHKASGLKWV
jgi:hypothetical protein